MLPRLDEVAKTSETPLKAQLNGADGTVTLLADDDLGAAVQSLHCLLPCGHFLELMIAGFFTLFVVLLPEHEHHNVRILLNRAGFAQIAQLGTFVFAALDLT